MGESLKGSLHSLADALVARRVGPGASRDGPLAVRPLRGVLPLQPRPAGPPRRRHRRGPRRVPAGPEARPRLVVDPGRDGAPPPRDGPARRVGRGGPGRGRARRGRRRRAPHPRPARADPGRGPRRGGGPRAGGRAVRGGRAAAAHRRPVAPEPGRHLRPAAQAHRGRPDVGAVPRARPRQLRGPRPARHAPADGGRVRQGRGALKTALELQPGSARAYQILGDIYARAEQADQAILHYRKALEIEPGNVRIRLALGEVLVQAKRPQEALAEADGGAAPPTPPTASPSTSRGGRCATSGASTRPRPWPTSSWRPTRRT